MAVGHEAPDDVIDGFRQRVLDPKTPLPAKYRALFALRNLKGHKAEASMVSALQDPSALFRHEVAYCLGQRQDPAAIPTLQHILCDDDEHSMVRHEAGEALGAIGGAQCLQLLSAHQADPCLEVAQTCQLALQRIQHYSTASSAAPLLQPLAPCDDPAACCAAHPDGGSGDGRLAACEPAATSARTSASLAGSSSAHAAKAVCQADGMETAALCACHDNAAPQRCQHHGIEDGLPEPEEASPYLSVDPAPAAPHSTPTPALRALLLDESAPIFQRYRALFALRNRGGRAAVEALDASLGGTSALLKHEVAYVLGQMQDPAAISALERVLRDTGEHAMVRHEAAEALGSIADERCVALLQEYCADAEPIVAQSCEVALDMLAHEASGEFQYAA